MIDLHSPTIAMHRLAHSIMLLLLCCAGTSLAQPGIVIDAEKDSFYTALTGPEDGYIHISHTEYLPCSGGMPDGEADLSADVWAAWDETYFYIYAEVKDDSVCGTSQYGPNNDCLELKFDPNPTRKAWSGLVNARLTALDSADAVEIDGVDNLYVERHLDSAASHPSNYSRRRTPDGYVLEARLAWSWITAKGRRVVVGPGNVVGLSVTFHENDSDTRDGSIQWSAGMADEVWIVPQLLGTIEFLEGNRLRFDRRSSNDPSARPGKTFLSMERYEDPRFRRFSIQHWKYHPGDDIAWATPDLDDRSWETVNAQMPMDQLPLAGWEGIGWFRAAVTVDSSFRNVPLAYWLSIHTGASEVYLDGVLISSLGTLGTTGREEEPRREIYPRFLTFSGDREHILAVRYSNFQRERLDRYEMPFGFDLMFQHNANQAAVETGSAVRTVTVFQAAFSAVPFLLVLLHLFLFIYYPRAKENLYFAGAVFFWALVILVNFTRPFTENWNLAFMMLEIQILAVGLGLVFILLTIYQIFLGRIPRYLWVFAALAIGVSVWFYVAPAREPRIAQYVLIGITTAELVRVFIVAGPDRRRKHWLTAVAFGFALIAIVVQVLMDLGLIPYMIIYPYGMLLLSVAVSFDIARNIAKTRKDLEVQLRQVQELSAKTLEQERRAKEDEIARKILEADNLRKTQELEEARKFQLSMLPNTVPSVPYLDIAVYMKPATEVGGDYYDFHCNGNGSLTVAVGDATGHGMKAGTMVATTKGLFSASGNSMKSLEFFDLCTRTIKEMHLGNLYMALMIARIQRGKMTVASAGMPPILIYRAATGSLEEIVLKGMPLGAHTGFPYAERETELHPRDTVLMMSDGFSELFNHQRQLIGPTRVRELFAETAEQSPHVIIDHLTNEGDSWRNGEPVHDDITFVVLKVKG